MQVDTVFDLASVTKVFATATLAAVLVERGWIRWDQPIRSIFPEHPSRGITLAHLLSHTSGLPWWAPYWERIRARFEPSPLYEVPFAERQAEMRRLVLATAPEHAPGERAVYSDVSFLLLGFALEEIVGMPLDRAVRELVWEPMGVEGAFYRRVTRSPETDRQGFVAATEDSAWRGGVLQGQVHDDNCWSMGGVAAHAGAFAAVRDVLHFAQRLLGGFLSPRILRAAWSRVPSPPGCERTLGWDTPSGDNPSASRLSSPGTVGHLGFTGTSLWIDPKAGLAVTLLTNRVHPTRDNVRIRDFRPRFHEALRWDIASATL